MREKQAETGKSIEKERENNRNIKRRLKIEV